MSVEVRLGKLEAQHKNLDANQHSLARVCADIKNIALTNQHDIAGVKTDVACMKTDIVCMKTDIAGLKGCIAALTEATHAGFKRTDERHDELVKEVREFKQETRERFDQLELLIRQLLPNANN